MTLRLRPASTDFDFLYKEVIAGITPGTQFLTVSPSVDQSLVLPYTFSQPTTFILEGAIGDKVKIYINNKQVFRLNLSQAKTEIALQLVPGRNFILIKSPFEEYLILVAATNYATFLRAWSQQFFNYCQIKLDDAERQLNSNFSLRAIEHQLNFQELLPPARVLRILAGKLAIRALINEGGTTRGVNDIATAISNTTPIVVPTKVNLEKYEPAVYTLYDTAHDFGGHEFNIWMPNIAAAGWAAFIKLADNLDDDIIKLTSVSDLKVSFDFAGQPETHIFDMESTDTDIISIITRLLDCFFPIRIGVELSSKADLAFCAWAPIGELRIDDALEVSRLDVGTTLDTGEFLDSADPADPLSDGWLGTTLSPPLDSGLSLDTVLQTSLFDDLECAFSPIVTSLTSSLLDIQVPIPLDINVNMIIDGNDFGWILGESQLNTNNLLG